MLNNQVVLISGETGCGKTTQVPQFFMDDALQRGQPCRIVCTQPRRISAITVAERVANEWGEAIGKTVGYNIRLESRMQRDTALLFCTTGLLLRMMSSNGELDGVTHVIMDEVHERDRYRCVDGIPLVAWQQPCVATFYSALVPLGKTPLTPTLNPFHGAPHPTAGSARPIGSARRAATFSSS